MFSSRGRVVEAGTGTERGFRRTWVGEVGCLGERSREVERLDLRRIRVVAGGSFMREVAGGR